MIAPKAEGHTLGDFKMISLPSGTSSEDSKGSMFPGSLSLLFLHPGASSGHAGGRLLRGGRPTRGGFGAHLLQGAKHMVLRI